MLGDLKNCLHLCFVLFCFSKLSKLILKSPIKITFLFSFYNLRYFLIVLGTASVLVLDVYITSTTIFSESTISSQHDSNTHTEEMVYFPSFFN